MRWNSLWMPCRKHSLTCFRCDFRFRLAASYLQVFMQCFVSLRRIEKYLNGAEVKPVLPLSEQSKTIAFQSCTVTWPQDKTQSSNTSSLAPSTSSTPRNKFVLVDLSLNFPSGELSLICGKLGSGKTLLLLSLLGEADILSGQLLCPRSPPDALVSYADFDVSKEEWVVQGMCAYVPQVRPFAAFFICRVSNPYHRLLGWGMRQSKVREREL